MCVPKYAKTNKKNSFPFEGVDHLYVKFSDQKSDFRQHHVQDEFRAIYCTVYHFEVAKAVEQVDFLQSVECWDG